jgi:glycosyltransferase involved in cell wall biosynthesis
VKVALIAPFEEPVPPPGYGGTERVVYNLAEGLVQLGHDVTLFASAHSHTSAKLIACVKQPIRTSPLARNHQTRQAENLRGLVKALGIIRNGDYDIVHNHFGWQALLFNDLFQHPLITTLHGTLAEPTEKYMHTLYKELPFVSISNSQRRHGPDLNYVATVYNGIDVEKFSFNDKPKDYLMFLGRIHPHKGPEYAIEIAKKSGRKLIIAAKIDPVDEAYFEAVVKPYIDGEQIIFVPEPEERPKIDLLKNAAAVIAPIQWDEPFGIVNIEALACGTPVITIKRGSTPEIIIDGKNGYLCSNIDEMIDRVADIGKINRRDCRARVAEHFTALQMAKGYEKAYRKVIAN